MSFRIYDRFNSHLPPQGRDHETFPEGRKRGHAAQIASTSSGVAWRFPDGLGMNNRVLSTIYLWIILFMLLRVGRRNKSGKLSILGGWVLYFEEEAQ
jgi:hypothetical protein